jgi:hypothetical protein
MVLQGTAGGQQDAERRWADAARMAILAPLALLVVAALVRSMGWRMEHDVPLAHYSAFMHAEYGAKPYENLFEISFPGTILMHLGITRIFGYGDRGLMVANALWFLGLSGATYALMSRFGRSVAFGAVTLFGVAYFGFGQDMMMQRDCVLILFVTCALFVYARDSAPTAGRRAIIGLLVGAAAAIKPHSGIALVPIAVDDVWTIAQGIAPGDIRGFAKRVTAAALGYGAGFAIPVALVGAWLFASGGFPAWLEMSRSYLPLYLHMRGDHKTVRGMARALSLVLGFLGFGGQSAWFLAAGTGAAILLGRGEARSPSARLGRLLIVETAAFAVYPVFSGQFWPYHYVPFIYFLALLASLCLTRDPAPYGSLGGLLPRVALAITLLSGPVVPCVAHLRNPPVLRKGQVDAMATFLEAHLEPGDTVQPLDWTGGVVHAMLISRARLATRFMYDYHFYHHVSNPFIQVLRQRFLAEIGAARPRFVVDYFGESKPWPSGEDTTRDFPELRAFLADNYVVDVSSDNYRIYERRSDRAVTRAP